VDAKSYLLDFRSFEQTSENSDSPSEVKTIQIPVAGSSEILNHNMMQFFELCASLIGSLAR
jgi:hypothetical protein